MRVATAIEMAQRAKSGMLASSSVFGKGDVPYISASFKGISWMAPRSYWWNIAAIVPCQHVRSFSFFPGVLLISLSERTTSRPPMKTAAQKMFVWRMVRERRPAMYSHIPPPRAK